MDQRNVELGVRAYREMTPESIDVFRVLSDEEVVAVKVVLAITEAPKVGRPRKRKATEAK
jgi:hypothetical protein